jgi:putative FmdB family regulatory protein
MCYRLKDMPIYEYQCRACQHQFEAIVRVSELPRCPACGGQELDRLISQFAVDSGGTRQRSLASIQRQNAKITRDKDHADFEYDKKHRHE